MRNIEDSAQNSDYALVRWQSEIAAKAGTAMYLPSEIRIGVVSLANSELSLYYQLHP